MCWCGFGGGGGRVGVITDRWNPKSFSFHGRWMGGSGKNLTATGHTFLLRGTSPAAARVGRVPVTGARRRRGWVPLEG